MKQIGVVYATKTGHSQKLAEAIAKALHAKAENVKGGTPSRAVDLLFIVGGIYAGKSAPDLLRYVEGLSAGQAKAAVLVTSSASPTRNQPEIRRILTEKAIRVLDEIGCPGSFLFLRAGHPNAADLEQVAERAKQIAANHEVRET